MPVLLGNHSFESSATWWWWGMACCEEVTIKWGALKHMLREACIRIQALPTSCPVILGRSLFTLRTHLLTIYYLLLKALGLQCWEKTMAIANIFSHSHSLEPYKKTSGTVLSLLNLSR